MFLFPELADGNWDHLKHRPKLHSAVRTDDYLFHQLIPYIGNKRRLLPLIAEAVQRTGVEEGTFADLFAGSSVVARLAKVMGYRVVANDWEPYAEAINRAYVGCNAMPAFRALGSAEAVFRTLNELPPREGYVTRHLCPADDEAADPDRERMFFTRENGLRIDAVREAIAGWEAGGAIDADERAVLLASLVYAVSYTSNTSGVFKAYHRGWGGRTSTALYRIRSRLTLRPPMFVDNGQENRGTRMDAQALAEALAAEGPVDIAYLDPPYNQHPYGSNYHVLNTVVLWDAPPVPVTPSRGTKSAIRTDWRTERRSAFNREGEALQAYRALLGALDARHILISYSTEGNIPLEELLEASTERGRVDVVMRAYKRYRVSAQRYSKKPLNVEFVLHIDAGAPARGGEARRLKTRILDAEARALSDHPAAE